MRQAFEALAARDVDGLLPLWDEHTGRRLDLRGIDVMRFDDGILRRNDVYYDGLTFARQLGMLPAADSSADRRMVHAFNALTRGRRRVGIWLDRRRR